MKTFDSWYIELIEDERWYEMAGRNHKKETFEATALKVYTLGISDSQSFFVTPMREHRNHVYNKICKITPDKVRKNWVEEAIKKQEADEQASKPPWVPLTGEARKQRLQEYLEVIQSAPMVKPIAPLSSRELIENSDWRPKPETIREPSEMEKLTAARKHYETMRASRTATFLEAFADASPEEIEAYLNKFLEIDKLF